MRNVSEIQQFLLAQTPPYDLGPWGADGTLGFSTLKAINLYLQGKNRPPLVGRPTLIEVNQAMFPEEQPLAPSPKPSLFDQLGTLLSLVQLLKGQTMTADQITGIIRLLLGLLGGYFVSKGIVTQSLFDWISAGVLTAVPGMWSWFSNRPKTIVPISAK